MAERLKQNKILILLLLTGAVFFFLKYISPLVAPVLVAMLFVTIFGPVLKKMQEKLHIHRQIGAVVLLLTAGVLFLISMWLLAYWLMGSIPEWLDGMEVLEERMTVWVHNGCLMAEHAVGMDATFLENRILGGVRDGFDYFQVRMVPEMLSQSLRYAKSLGVVGGFLLTFVIASVLLAKDYDRIMNLLLERESCHVLLEIICGIIRYIATFVKAQIIIMSLIGGGAALVLTLAGIPRGAMWGILAGVMDVLPFIGTGIVLLPLALVQIFAGRYTDGVVCILLYLGCVIVREWLEPKLIGKHIGVTPVVVLVALYAGIQLFGLWGIIKGPLGFVMIQQAYLSILRREERNLS